MRSGFATGIQVISNSSEDVDFYIHELYPIHFFGTTVYITTTHVCTFIVLLVIAILAICARRSVLKTRDNPSKFATGVELAIESLIKFVNSTMGKEAGKHYINYIGTLFIFVLFSNISGLFMLRPPTADYGTTLCIALVSFVMKRIVRNRYDGTLLWHAADICKDWYSIGTACVLRFVLRCDPGVCILYADDDICCK